jgi:hypothetical protein
VRHFDLRPNSIPEKLSFTTVRIESTIAGGLTSRGTGFFYNHILNDGKNMVPLIITNKHVIDGAIKGGFHVHLLDEKSQEGPSGRFVKIEFSDFGSKWIGHPNPDVDLCAMLFQPIRDEQEHNGVRFYNAPLTSRQLPSPELFESLQPLCDIVMPGYPLGHWDSHNNMPLIRKGVTATHPSLDYEGRPMFIADIASFAGSSGSPVLLYNQGTYTDTNGVHVGERFALIGVTFAGLIQQLNGVVSIEPIPTALRGTANITTLAHLACVIKSSEILKLAEFICAPYQNSNRAG